MQSQPPRHSVFAGLDRRTLWAAGAVAALLFVATLVSAVFNAYSAIYDDAYIYFRYARNIAAGCGPTFNCGTTYVEGFSSPLYQALLSLCAVFTRDVETAATSLGALGGWFALCATALLPARLNLGERDARIGSVLVGLAGLVLGGDAYIRVQMFTGMETWLGWLATAAIAFTAMSRQRRGMLAPLVALCTLVRPEFGAFVPFLLVFPEMRRRRPWIGVIAILAVVTAARLAVFGVPLPNTFYVKQGGTFRHFLAGLDYLAGTFYHFPLLLLAPAAVFALSRQRRAVYFVLGGSAVWFAFQLRSGGDFYGYSRVLMPLIPLLEVLGLVGAVGLAKLVARRSKLDGQRAGKVAVTVLTAAMLLMYLMTSGRLVRVMPSQGTRSAIWSAAGKWLAKELPPHARVATVSVGAIAYFSGLDVIDMIGLTDARIGRHAKRIDDSYPYLTIGHETYNVPEVLARHPEAIILLQPRANTLAEDPHVLVGMPAESVLLHSLADGSPAYVVATPQFGSRRLVVLLRSDIAASVDAGQTWPPSKMVIDYRSPHVPYPWLALLGLMKPDHR